MIVDLEEHERSLVLRALTYMADMQDAETVKSGVSPQVKFGCRYTRDQLRSVSVKFEAPAESAP